MRVLFLPAWLDGLSRNSASPRIRCEWVARYWDNAEVYDGTQSLAEYEVLVFQKAYLTTRSLTWANRYRDGKRILLFDLCDPEWLDPRKMGRLLVQLTRMDAAVVPTKALAGWVSRWLPCYVIPDRLDLALHLPRDGTEEPYFEGQVGVLWFGGSQNYPALEMILPDLLSLDGVRVAVLSDRPIPDDRVAFIQWEDVEQANDTIKRFDVVVNPQPPGGIYAYKSDNKTATAHALGVPTASTAGEVARLVEVGPAVRRAIGERKRREAEMRYDVRASVVEWQAVIEDVVTWRAGRSRVARDSIVRYVKGRGHE